jgi:NADH dehydrogenase
MKAKITHKKIVIVGAGFGGLWAVRALGKTPANVTLIDRHNYHLFSPLLYQVAAAEIEPDEIAYPIRNIVRKYRNVEFLMGEVQNIDLSRGQVEFAGRLLDYDYLIIATGSISSFFGVDGAAEYAFRLKSMTEATMIRNHILCCFEKANYEADSDRRWELLTFVIIGGGPTGVEFAGALAELIQGPLAKDYPKIDFSLVKIVLVEGSDRVLPTMSAKAGAYALKRLGTMKIDVQLNSPARKITRDGVYLKDGSFIQSGTIIWTAGVTGSMPEQIKGISQRRTGLLQPLSTLQIPDYPNAYVIGDLAGFVENGYALPMVAPVAMQQGECAALNIMRQIEGLEPIEFKYHNKGVMATIGRNKAVVQLKRLSFTGFIAWVMWLGLHLAKLIGFRNRLQVLINWAWDYLFYEKAIRLIFKEDKSKPVKDEKKAANSIMK